MLTIQVKADEDFQVGFNRVYNSRLASSLSSIFRCRLCTTHASLGKSMPTRPRFTGYQAPGCRLSYNTILSPLHEPQAVANGPAHKAAACRVWQLCGCCYYSALILFCMHACAGRTSTSLRILGTLGRTTWIWPPTVRRSGNSTMPSPECPSAGPVLQNTIKGLAAATVSPTSGSPCYAYRCAQL